jgi:hypothetical protein
MGLNLPRRVALVAAACLACAGMAAVPLTSASATPSSADSLPTPSPRAGHKIEFPTQQEWHQGRGNGHQFGPAGAQAASTAQLTYHGGVDGIGVTSGQPKVYLVFWGSQWGTQGTDANGNTTFTGDPAGMAPRLQQLFKGLGTGNELWSGVLTQYCDGANVANGATSCAANTAHVGYPAGGVLANIWFDTSTAPTSATEYQLAGEAVTAASHFGNTTAASNRYAQYVIVSPKGLHPDGFNNPLQWCAWHDYNGDTTLTGGGAYPSNVGDVAFTNLPYLTDVGASCGANYVNGAGALDGVTIVEGHEYAETLTDQNPGGGWWDSSGAENGDKCAWVGTGGTGGAQNVTMSTGSFPMQATWSNADSSCRIARAVTTGGNAVTVNNPGNQSTPVSTAGVHLQIQASDSGGSALTYTQTGLPPGLSISPSGLISGTTASTGGTYTVTVTATDTTSASGSTSFTWTVTVPCVKGQQVVNNGNFDTGSALPWWSMTTTSGSASRLLNNSTLSGKEPPSSGNYDALLGSLGISHTDTVSQSLVVPAGCTSYPLSFNLHIDTAETTTTRSNDRLTVRIGSTTLASYSNLNKNTGYATRSFNLAAYAGQTVTLTFTATENSSRQTSFVIDDVSLPVS